MNARANNPSQLCILDRGDSAPPGLTLVLGPPNSGKMGRVLEWWQGQLGLQPLIVAPTGPDARELTQEMLRRVGVLMGHGPAVTFDGLVEAVLGERPRYMDGLRRDLVLRGILSEERLPALGSAAGFPGTLTALSALLHRLEESGLRADEVDAILQRWARSDPAAASLADDLNLAVRRYAEARTGCERTDRPAAVRAACEGLASWSRPVALYGFTSFTPGQRTLIEALCSRAPVLLTLAFERSSPVNLVQKTEMVRWEVLAEEVVELAAQPHAYSSPSVAHLERNFMRARSVKPPAASGDGSEGVFFLLASGQRNEAELAAERIAALMREGFHPGRIGVVVRNVGSWSSVLSQVFGSCHIPFRLDLGRELRHTGLGHALLSALEGYSFDDAETLLVYLRGPYSGVPPATVARVETVYRSGLERGVARLAALVDQEAPGALAAVRRTVNPEGVGAGIDIDGLETLVAHLLAAGLRGLSLISREAEDDVRSYAAVKTAVVALRELAMVENGGAPLAVSAVLPAIERLMVPAGPVEGQDAVQILSPQRARARRFDALLVLGLVDGEFPARLDAPSLLTEHQRARLNSLGGGELLPPEIDTEAALFAALLSRTWQVLYLSSRDADDGGSEAFPSPFWQECLRLLRPESEADFRRTLSSQVYPVQLAPTARHFERACAARGRSLGRSAAARGPRGGHDGAGSAIPSMAAGAATGAGRVVPAWSRPAPFLDHPQVLAELAARDCFSPSELERYLGCPFGWFLERVVRVEDVEVELDGRALGTLAHAALCSTYRDLKSAGSLPVTADNLALAVRAARRAIQTLVDDGAFPGSVADRRMAAWRLTRMVESLLEMESASGSALVAEETELWVGGTHGVDIGGVCLRGKIDRVDADAKHRVSFVIDYKTGSIPAKADIGTEKGLQLPLYLLALSRERPESRVVGGAYVSLADQRRSGVAVSGETDLLGAWAEGCRVLDEDAEDVLFSDAVRVASGAADGIRRGRIAPLPDRKCPFWCQLGPACRAQTGGYRP